MSLRMLSVLAVFTLASGLMALTVGEIEASEYKAVSENLPKLKIAFADPAWDGKTIPDGQQCPSQDGHGATPALIVDNIPSGTNTIIVEFNDSDYRPLSYDGGHGKIGFWIGAANPATLPSVPGLSDKLPEGSFIEADNRAWGKGYVPPCSGGRGNSYFAIIKAVYKAKSDKEKSLLLATGTIELGSY